MAPAWAAGLTVTTTGLNQQEKQAVKNDVEAAGGRYSPNLSKRTTHLVTPDVIGSLSDKLAAAAGEDSRFSARIVSIGWIAASAASNGKAAELQYTPAMPSAQQATVLHSEPATPATNVQLSSASSGRHMQHGAVLAGAAAPTPICAAAAPQRPWVVHFSQMGDDSIYGMPQPPSPSVHERLAEQLQEHQQQQELLLLQPIAEEQSQGVSPVPARRAQAQAAACSYGISPEAADSMARQQPAAADLCKQPPALVIPAGALTPSACLQSMIQHRPHMLQLPGAEAVAGANVEASVLAAAEQDRATPVEAAAPACGQQPTSAQKAAKSRAAFGAMLAAPAATGDYQTSSAREGLKSTIVNRYTGLHSVDMDISSSLIGGKAAQRESPLVNKDGTAAAAVAGVAAAAAVPQQAHHLLCSGHQQEWRWQRQQQPQQAERPAVPGGCETVDQLISALRRVTTDGRKSTSEGVTSPLPAEAPSAEASAALAAAAMTGQGGHSSPLQQKQQQQQQPSQTPSTGGVSAAGFGGVPSCGGMRHVNSSVDELIGALQRVTDSSRRSTAEAPPQTTAGMYTPGELQQQQQQQDGPLSGSLFGSLGSVDDLILALRRATCDSARTAVVSAGGIPEPSQGPVAPLSQQQQPQWPWERAAATPQQQQQEAVHDGAGAADCPPPATPISVDELILALRRVTGDSRRSTAEAAPSSPDVDRWEPQQLWLGQHANPQPGGLHPGGLGSVDDLLGALQRATGDSRRGTADSAIDAPTGLADTSLSAAAAAAVTGSAAEKQKGWLRHDPGASAAVAAAAAGGKSAGLFGSMSGVDDLLGALRRATGDTADPADAAHTGTDNSAAAALMGAGAKQLSEVDQGLAGAAVADVVAERTSVLGSSSSVDDLIPALLCATGDGRRDTGEAAPDARGSAVEAAQQQQQQQQQHELRDEQRQPNLAALDSEMQRSFDTSSDFQDVLGALLQATSGSSHRAPADVAEVAVPLEQPWQQQQQQQQGQHRQRQPPSSDNQQPGSAACSPAHMSCSSSMKILVSTLNRVTAERQGKLMNAAEGMTTLPTPPAETAAAAAAAAGMADMQELVAALRRVTGEDQVPGGSCAASAGSTTPCRPLVIAQSGAGALGHVQHIQQEQQQQQQHDGLVRGLLLQAQQEEHGGQLHLQRLGAGGSCLKAAWGSAGGDELPAATAAAAAATNSNGIEQLLAALRGSAISGGLPSVYDVRDGVHGNPAQNGGLDLHESRESAAALALMRQKEQQRQQQQEAAAMLKLQSNGNSSCRTPAAAAAEPDSLLADQATSRQQQQQQHSGVAEVLMSSNSPAVARQLWCAEADASISEQCSEPELSLSQLVHALQGSGNHRAGTGGQHARHPAAPDAYTAPLAAAVLAADQGRRASAECEEGLARDADDGVNEGAGHVDVCKFPTSTPHAVQLLQASAEPPSGQQHGAPGLAAEAAAETTAEAPPPPQLPVAAVAAVPAGLPSQQQAPAASTGLQPCSLSCMAVAFDHSIPAELRQDLAAAVAAAGGCVVPGQPHLGCGANTVVAEPQHAAQWLQLLMHIVSPAWLLKACKQQEQQQQGSRPQQQLVCLSPDVARALGWCGKPPQAGHGGQQQREDTSAGVAAAAAAAAAGGGNSECPVSSTSNCGSGGSPPRDTVPLLSNPRSSTVGATAHAPGHSSGSTACRTILTGPGGLLVDGMGLSCVPAAAGAGDADQQQQQQPVLMPPGLLEGLLWSVDQDPSSVGDEETEAVILQHGTCSITLLLPQDSSGLLGHAPVLVSPCQPSKGLTCSDVLQAIHSFYQQEVLLLQQPVAGGGAVGVGSGCNGGECVEEPRQGNGGQLAVRRLQLLGARLLLEGLVRATRDPCSCVYEVCLA